MCRGCVKEVVLSPRSSLSHPRQLTNKTIYQRLLYSPMLYEGPRDEKTKKDVSPKTTAKLIIITCIAFS